MKTPFPFLMMLVGAAAFIGGGCMTGPQVNTAHELGVIDTLPDSASKGYVEFYTRSANGPLPIYLIDANKNPQLLAAVGLDAGDKYYARPGMKVSERLRVAAPVGTHTFAIQEGGPQVQVPVKADQVTRVEVDYDPLDDSDAFVVYRLDYAVLDPVQVSDAVGSAPKSE